MEIPILDRKGFNRPEIFKTDFVIRGTKEELLEAEELLKEQNINSKEKWNRVYREKYTCLYLACYCQVFVGEYKRSPEYLNKYLYHSHDCTMSIFSFQEFKEKLKQ